MDPSDSPIAGDASCRCVSFPAWPSQLVRQELSGPPSFRVLPSTLATRLDPGKPSSPLPVTGDSVLDTDSQTSSRLAFESLEAKLLKRDAALACGSRFSRDTLLDSRWFR